LAKLQRVKLSGFKSIKEMDLELRPLNVLIGANGAGKSNLVSFFKMLNEMMAGRLQKYVATSGRAQSILYFGPKVTPQMEATLEFDADGVRYFYLQELMHTAGDKLAFSNEAVGPEEMKLRSLGSGHEETLCVSSSDRESRTAGMVRHLLSQCRVYHFNDTSSTARVRQHCYVANNRVMMSDASNLAAFLWRLQNEYPDAYQRIVTTIKLIAPYFNEFSLVPTGRDKNEIILNWFADSDFELTGTILTEEVFGPHQLSDGTLRAMCLITLLLQPEHELPELIIVDEPELGLHPYAISVIASLFKKASHHAQVLISTQSPTFLDQFDPEDVVVVNREGKESRFVRPNVEQLESWLEEYSLGEVWEKNVIGGGPH
jgi:predicted ATPase